MSVATTTVIPGPVAERGGAMSARRTAAASTVVLPAFVAVVGLPLARRNPVWGREWAVLGAVATLAAALVEAWAVYTGRRPTRVPFLGLPRPGLGRIALDLRADALSAHRRGAVGLVALCVQVYSTAYLAEIPDDPVEQAPTRYPAYAATVSLFTAAMMTVVHADDLVLLLLGLGGHGRVLLPARRPPQRAAAARAAAVKAFLVTRVGDLGVLLGGGPAPGGHRHTSHPGRPRPPRPTLPPGTVARRRAAPARRRRRASPPSSRCTPGCPTRWRARRRCRR